MKVDSCLKPQPYQKYKHMASKVSWKRYWLSWKSKKIFEVCYATQLGDNSTCQDTGWHTTKTCWPRDVWCHCHIGISSTYCSGLLGWTLVCEAHCPTEPHDPQDAEEKSIPTLGLYGLWCFSSLFGINQSINQELILWMIGPLDKIWW